MAKDLDDKAPARPEFEAETFIKDVRAVMSSREQVANRNQSHGTKLQTIEETRGYDMQAFKAIVTLAKKSPETRKSFLETFEFGVEALRLKDDDQPDLLDAAGADDDNAAERKETIKEAVTAATKGAKGKRNGKGGKHLELVQ